MYKFFSKYEVFPNGTNGIPNIMEGRETSLGGGWWRVVCGGVCVVTFVELLPPYSLKDHPWMKKV